MDDWIKNGGQSVDILRHGYSQDCVYIFADAMKDVSTRLCNTGEAFLREARRVDDVHERAQILHSVYKDTEADNGYTKGDWVEVCDKGGRKVTGVVIGEERGGNVNVAILADEHEGRVTLRRLAIIEADCRKFLRKKTPTVFEVAPFMELGCNAIDVCNKQASQLFDAIEVRTSAGWIGGVLIGKGETSANVNLITSDGEYNEKVVAYADYRALLRVGDYVKVIAGRFMNEGGFIVGSDEDKVHVETGLGMVRGKVF